MSKKTLTGYCDPLSVAPGDTLRFMVGCDEPGDYEASIVRVVCGDDGEDAPGIIEEPVASSVDGIYAGRHQPIHPGSFASVPASSSFAGLDMFVIELLVYPTAPARGRQTFVSIWQPEASRGVRLGIGEEGDLELCRDDLTLRTEQRLRAQRWYRVAARFDGSAVTLEQELLSLSPGNDVERGSCSVLCELEGTSFSTPEHTPVLIGARPRAFDGETILACDHFNGKIEAPRILASDGETIAHWDFSLEIPTQRIVDRGPGALHGQLHQLPTRAVTGHNWDGSVHAWTQAPEQYGAIHFHDDDVADAGWTPDFELEVPDDLPSGIYAARLRQGESEDRITFFVRAKQGRPTSQLAVLIPTASYLAYANYRLRLTPNPIFGAGTPFGENDVYLRDHPELGSSLYDRHSDYSGVHFSSRLRPIQNLKSGGNRAWQFPADTNLVAWLHKVGQSYDVVTDEDVHRNGTNLLAPYRCVVTGTHPEYTSTAMLDALSGYLDGGGRLMYMGGNGFYWRIAFSEEHPGAIEVRRAEDGTRAWIAEPGEYYHAWGGEYGGLWRRIGRPPNHLVGVGFAAQGFDRSSHYRRAPTSSDPRVAFLFEGVEDDILGDFGSIGGGAAGEEIDRYDQRLGSPQHALVVASSEGHSQEMLRTKEEFLSTVPWFEDPKVRADLTFFECPNGGAVFSTGSIAWCGALNHEGGNNNIARITANALRRFLDPEPFELPPV